MQCQECGKRPASLHFTKIVNGAKTELHICETCAREKGELIPGTSSGFSIHNLIATQQLQHLLTRLIQANA